VLIWAGVTAAQTYRAADACVSVSAATTVHFGLLATTVVAALFMVSRAWLSSADTSRIGRADAIAPVIVLCIGLTLATRLIELCSGPRLVP
jgi:hypothetical protein